MLGVVEADAQDVLARIWDRREQGDVTFRDAGADQCGGLGTVGEALQRRERYRAEVDQPEHGRWQRHAMRGGQPLDVDAKAVGEKAEPRGFLANAISCEAHRYLPIK